MARIENSPKYDALQNSNESRVANGKAANNQVQEKSAITKEDMQGMLKNKDNPEVFEREISKEIVDRIVGEELEKFRALGTKLISKKAELELLEIKERFTKGIKMAFSSLTEEEKEEYIKEQGEILVKGGTSIEEFESLEALRDEIKEIKDTLREILIPLLKPEDLLKLPLKQRLKYVSVQNGSVSKIRFSKNRVINYKLQNGIGAINLFDEDTPAILKVSGRAPLGEYKRGKDGHYYLNPLKPREYQRLKLYDGDVIDDMSKEETYDDEKDKSFETKTKVEPNEAVIKANQEVAKKNKPAESEKSEGLQQSSDDLTHNSDLEEDDLWEEEVDEGEDIEDEDDEKYEEEDEKPLVINTYDDLIEHIKNGHDVLPYITKGKVSLVQILNGDVNKITFTFPNAELSLKTKLGEVLPKEITSVYDNDSLEYKRDPNKPENGDFNRKTRNGNKRFSIAEGIQVFFTEHNEKYAHIFGPIRPIDILVKEYGIKLPEGVDPKIWENILNKTITSTGKKVLEKIGSKEGNYRSFNFSSVPRSKWTETSKFMEYFDITKMSIAEVLNLQYEYRNIFGGTGAIGKYQFMPSTLIRTMAKYGVDPYETIFSPDIQDKLAMLTLQDMRVIDFIKAGKINLALDQMAILRTSIPNQYGKLEKAGTKGNGKKSSVTPEELKGYKDMLKKAHKDGLFA